jgi:hypothetical protein
MPIQGTELKMYRSALVSDVAATNGGVMSNTEIVSSVNNNIFPDVPQAERTTGSTKYRKVFFKNTNTADLVLLSPRLFIEKYTQGDDAVYFTPGTHSDLQSALSGTPKLYGAGKLDSNVAAGAQNITVLLEDASTPFFKDGDTIRISNKADVNATGFEEFHTISGAPTVAGSIATIHLAAPLVNAYTAADTRVANVYVPGATVAPSITDTNVATVGNGDLAFGSVVLGNLGTIYDTWTLTFTSSTAFTMAGARYGSAGTGNTLATLAPVNPDTGTALFTIPASAFTGAWAAGDTATFTTNPAAVGVFLKRVVPAGSAAISGNRFVVAIDGETA